MRWLSARYGHMPILLRLVCTLFEVINWLEENFFVKMVLGTFISVFPMLNEAADALASFNCVCEMFRAMEEHRLTSSKALVSCCLRIYMIGLWRTLTVSTSFVICKTGRTEPGYPGRLLSARTLWKCWVSGQIYLILIIIQLPSRLQLRNLYGFLALITDSNNGILGVHFWYQGIGTHRVFDS